MIAYEQIRRRESLIELSSAGERYRRSWQPPEPTRVMVLVHGYAEHTGRYDEMAMHFAVRGYAVHAYDQAGHGRTKGPRGHVDRFDRLIEELARFLELVSLDYPGLPVTLVGHSLGGLVVTATAAFCKPVVDKIVLSGALLQLGGEGGGVRQSVGLGLAKMLALVIPRLAIPTGLDSSGISRDPEVVRRYEQDPLVEDRMSMAFAAGMSQLVVAASRAATEIDRPVLVLHGGDDPISPVAGSQRLFAGLKAETADKSRLKIYPNLRHEIFQEPERQRVWEDMIRFIESDSGK